MGLQMTMSGINRRMDPRFEPREGWIEITGESYKVHNVSASGVLVRPYDGALTPGGSFSFRLRLKDDNETTIVIDGGAVAIRCSNGEMAVQFFSLDHDQYPVFDDYLERRFRARSAVAEG